MSAGRKLLLWSSCLPFLLGTPALAAAADEGEKVYQESCTGCHNASTRPLEATRLSRQHWKDAVEKMEGLGADVPSGKKLSALLDYLERTHGPGAAPRTE